jgi:hypothetical protein
VQDRNNRRIALKAYLNLARSRPKQFFQVKTKHCFIKDSAFLIAFMAGLAVSSSGCATKAAFFYPSPPAHESLISDAKRGPKPIVVIVGVVDGRSDRDIDEAYEQNPIPEIQRILIRELEGVGVFKAVVARKEGAAPEIEPNDFHVEARLDVLKWEVPDYGSKVFWAFTTSLLTGGIGGVIYGSSDTDVYGHSQMRIRLSSMKTGQSVIEKDYLGVAKEVMSKFKCDTPETKRSMVGKALQNLFVKVLRDLYQLEVSSIGP